MTDSNDRKQASAPTGATTGSTADQTTQKGDMIVSIGRYGTRMARTGRWHSVPIRTTKIYRAERRADGVLTWRLHSSISDHATAGRGITGPMRARAEAVATERDLPFADVIRHGQECD